MVRGCGPPVVLGVGRLAPDKDFPTLIEAFRRVNSERSCRLCLGEGSPELEGLVREPVWRTGCRCRDGWKTPSLMARSVSLCVIPLRRFRARGRSYGMRLSRGFDRLPGRPPGNPRRSRASCPGRGYRGAGPVMLRALGRPADEAAQRARAARFSVDRAVGAYEARPVAVASTPISTTSNRTRWFLKGKVLA